MIDSIIPEYPLLHVLVVEGELIVALLLLDDRLHFVDRAQRVLSVLIVGGLTDHAQDALVEECLTLQVIVYCTR